MHGNRNQSIHRKDFDGALRKCEESNSNIPLIDCFRKHKSSLVYHIGDANSSYFIVPHTPRDFWIPRSASSPYDYFIGMQQLWFSHKDGGNKETFLVMIKKIFGDPGYKTVDCRNVRLVNGVVVRTSIFDCESWKTFAECGVDGTLISATDIIAEAHKEHLRGNKGEQLSREVNLVKCLKALLLGDVDKSVSDLEPTDSDMYFLWSKRKQCLDFVGGKLTWLEYEMNNEAGRFSGYLRAFMRETLEELLGFESRDADSLLNNCFLPQRGMCRFHDSPHKALSRGSSGNNPIFATAIVLKNGLWIRCQYKCVTPYLWQLHVSEVNVAGFDLASHDSMAQLLQAQPPPPPAPPADVPVTEGTCCGDASPSTSGSGVSMATMGIFPSVVTIYATVVFSNLETSAAAVDRLFSRWLQDVNSSHGKLFNKFSNIIKSDSRIKYHLLRESFDFITVTADKATRTPAGVEIAPDLVTTSPPAEPACCIADACTGKASHDQKDASDSGPFNKPIPLSASASESEGLSETALSLLVDSVLHDYLGMQATSTISPAPINGGTVGYQMISTTTTADAAAAGDDKHRTEPDDLSKAFSKLAVTDVSKEPLSSTTSAITASATLLAGGPVPAYVCDPDNRLLRTVHAVQHVRTATADTSADFHSASGADERYHWTLHFLLVFERMDRTGELRQLVKVVAHCNNVSEGSSLHDPQQTRVVNRNIRNAIVGRTSYSSPAGPAAALQPWSGHNRGSGSRDDVGRDGWDGSTRQTHQCVQPHQQWKHQHSPDLQIPRDGYLSYNGGRGRAGGRGERRGGGRGGRREGAGEGERGGGGGGGRRGGGRGGRREGAGEGERGRGGGRGEGSGGGGGVGGSGGGGVGGRGKGRGGSQC